MDNDNSRAGGVETTIGEELTEEVDSEVLVLLPFENDRNDRCLLNNPGVTGDAVELVVAAGDKVVVVVVVVVGVDWADA